MCAPLLAFCCCGNRMISICCTIWCIFGFVITGFLSILSDSDALYALVGVTNETHQADAVPAFAGSAAIYAVFAVICGIFWIYHDFIKKKKQVTRKYTTEAVEVELQTHLLTSGGGGGGAAAGGSEEPVEL